MIILKLQIKSFFIFTNMDKETIQSFLHRLGLDDKVEKFEEEDITLDLLLDLSEKELAETLKEMNLTIGKQMRIRKEIKDMNSRKSLILLDSLLVRYNEFRVNK